LNAIDSKQRLRQTKDTDDSKRYHIVPDLPISTAIPNNSLFLIATNNVTYFTHGLHKFPAKFIPQIPRWAYTKAKKGIEEGEADYKVDEKNKI